MYPTMLHIYGPITIQSYGVMIVAGILTALFLMSKDKNITSLMPFSEVLDIATVGIIAAVVGARVLFLIENGADSLWQAFALWQGGLSVLGSIIALLIALPIYCSIKKIPILKLLNYASVYAPLIQGISRIGCFLSGCCYGKLAFFWAFDCNKNRVIKMLLAPPLLSSLLLISLFLYLYSQRNNRTVSSGFLLGSYLYFAGFERFFTDFLRYDHEPIFFDLSQTQIIALSITTIGLFIKAYKPFKEVIFKKVKY